MLGLNDTTRKWVAAVLAITTVIGFTYWSGRTILDQQQRLDILLSQREALYLQVLVMADIGGLADWLDGIRLGDEKQRYEMMIDAANRWDRIEDSLTLLIGLKDDGHPNELRSKTWSYTVRIPESRMDLMKNIAQAGMVAPLMRRHLARDPYGYEQAEFCRTLAGLLREIEKTLRNNVPPARHLASNAKDALDLIEPQLIAIQKLVNDYPIRP